MVFFFLRVHCMLCKNNKIEYDPEEKKAGVHSRGTDTNMDLCSTRPIELVSIAIEVT